MITLRRAEARHHDRGRKREGWLTFDPADRSDPLADGFGALELLDEDHLSPRATLLRHPRHAAEIVTYVREGSLAYDDSTGNSGVISAGEFQRLTTGPAARHGGSNASSTASAHVFQMWLRPSLADLDPGREQKRFSVAERRGKLCVVASPDARRGSLTLHGQDLIYSAVLDPGQHVVHELSPGRTAWLHVVKGEATFRELILATGDGVGVSVERVVSLTAREKTEILLFDLAATQPRIDS